MIPATGSPYLLFASVTHRFVVDAYGGLATHPKRPELKY